MLTQVLPHEIPADVQCDLRPTLREAADPSSALPRYVDLHFDGSRTIAHFPVSNTFTFSDAAALQEVFQDVEAVTRMFTVIQRWQRNHPAKRGLVPVHFPVTHNSPTPTAVLEAASVGRYRNLNPSSESFLATLPSEAVCEHLGWFAPGSDPTVFGTFYMIPVGVISDDRESNKSSDRFRDLGWALAQVGIRDEEDLRNNWNVREQIGNRAQSALSFARWDDDEAMTALIDRALTTEVDLDLTVRALTDSDATQADLQTHRYRLAVLSAREAFAEHKVRPRLVEKAVEAAFSAVNAREHRVGSYYRHSGPQPGLQTLDDYSIFGWNSGVKPVNAAFLSRVNAETPLSVIKECVAAMQRNLDERNLGVVVIDPNHPYDQYVTTNFDLLSANRAAFQIADSARLVTAASWLI